MRLLLIPDKFKGSLTAAEVCSAISSGIQEVFPEAEITTFPASDGGDGFLEVVQSVRSVETFEVEVEDPLGRKICAPFLYDPGKGEAFVEMATASGLVLLADSERNPLRTHTRGTGQLIRAAAEKGARKIFVGLGGSATNDGGCGIATVFGYRFLDKEGNELSPAGAYLGSLYRIEKPGDDILDNVEVIAVNDVSNPLWGPEGAAMVYAAQKGASGDDISFLDKGLRHLDALVTQQLGVDAGSRPGAGAAGGAAYGLHCFLGAQFIGGTEYVLGITGVAEYLQEHPVDYICTGEGRIDAQTLHGKLIQGVLTLAGKYRIPVLAICGTCEVSVSDLNAAGIHDVLEVSDPSKTLKYNMDHAAVQVRNTVGGYFRKLLKA